MTFLTVQVGVVTEGKTFLEGSGVLSASVFVVMDQGVLTLARM